MKIGELVQRTAPAIFDYCETRDRAEFARLQDPRYSKETFGIIYPFCKPVAQIGSVDERRFYADRHKVLRSQVRVTNHWLNPPRSKSLPLLRQYCRKRGIPLDERDTSAPDISAPANAAAPAARGRYKASAIGNAQNALVRNLLSRLGDETFSAADWDQVIRDFGGRCAYCGADGDLVMDHVVPTNRQALGEHRLGNLVPACRSCNAKKADQDVRTFLAATPDRIAGIEAYMAKHGYTPIGTSETLRKIIDLAHQDVRHLAERYAGIIDTALQQNPEEGNG